MLAKSSSVCNQTRLQAKRLHQHLLSSSLSLTYKQRPFHSSPNSTARVLSNEYHDFIRYPITEGRTGRVYLKPPKLVGVATSRGMRGYMEDTHAISAIHIPPQELRHSVQRFFGLTWDPGHIGDSLAGQVVFLGIYDGHGGTAVSQYLQNELHGLFETADPALVQYLVQVLLQVGGYFKRFKGGALMDWMRPAATPRTLDLESRATLAFLAADKQISKLRESEQMGATASVALVHSLEPSAPFFASEDIALTVAHCGDTKVILAATDGGNAYPMTEEHHADARGEQARLRRMGQGIVTDSFGEARYMGQLANTRGFGDTKYKYFGMTPEPDIRTRRLKGQDWASIILVSDGITSVMTDDEIVGLTRNAPDAQRAAKSILKYGEDLGMDDNGTVLVVPLAGWGQIRGKDLTKELRDYKRAQAEENAKARRSNR